jgi:putative ABC transport system permease protein
MHNLPRDLRQAVRTLLRKPGVAALAVASLSLAIGFSTAAFSILDAYALRDLPVRDPNQLVREWVRTRENRGDGVSWNEYRALAAQVQSLAGLAVEDREGARVRLPGRDDFPIFGYVSDNYFDLLGVKAAMGDVFHAGRGQDQTVVISNHYWKDLLASDPAIIGRTLPVGPTVLRVIAVLPPGFTGTNRGLLVDLYMPPQTFFGALHASSPADLRYTSYEVVGRLRPGASRDQVRAESDGVLRQVESDGAAPGPEREMRVEEFGEGSFWQKLESNTAMLAIVVLLVLIAAANLANLRLVENESRRQETGLRLALGAGPYDLARQHLAETLLLAVAATGGGLLLARWLIGLAPALFYAGKRYTDYGIQLDARSFAFSSVALLAIALLGAAIPLMDAWRRRIMPALHGTRTTRSSRWLGVLVVTQMALVTGVACSAGLLWRSVDKLSQIRPAMDPDRKLLLVNGFFDSNGAAALPRIETLSEGLARLPGVESVAWARRVMLSGSGGGAVVDVQVAGEPKRPVPYNQVSPAYFSTTGARIVSGRGFTGADGPKSTPVVMVNALFVHRFLHDRDPLGAWIGVAGADRQIVGVVEDGPYNHLREEPQPYLYFAFAQNPRPNLTWMIQSSRDPGDLAGPVRTWMRAADATLTITSLHTFAEHMRDARSEQQLAATVSGALAGAGLLLAAAGLFGVTLFAVTRRIPEFGVRVAMGASPARLLLLVFREAALRVAFAVPLGWLLTYAGRRAIGKLLYCVAPDDPWTFGIATAAVAMVALLAALQPAFRASRIDPMTALRHD